MKQFMKDSKKVSDFLNLSVRKESSHVYEYHLRLFFEWKQIHDIDKYIKDPRMMNKKQRIQYEDNIKNDILAYWKYLNSESSGFHGKTPYPFLSAMRRFIETHEIIFSPEFWRNIRKNGNGNYAITDFQTPTKNQLKDILSNADTEQLAIFLTQMTSGQRIEQILKLKWSDIQLEHDYPRIFIRRQKGKRPIHTRITPEAKEYLLSYQKQYHRFIKTRESRTPEMTRKPLDTNRVFPMSHTNVENMWNNLTNKVGLYIKDPVTNRPLYGTHCLRRYFQHHSIHENDALFFMGKKPENIATYLRYSPEQLDTIYIKNSENFTVFKDKSDTPEYLKNYDEKINKFKDELNISNDKNELYKRRLTSQEDRLKKIENILMNNLKQQLICFDNNLLSEEEEKLEDNLVNKIVLQKEYKLKKLIASDPRYKNDEIFYIDRTYDSNGNITNYGNPVLIRNEKNKEDEEFNKIFDKINKQSLIEQLSSLSKTEQLTIIKEVNKKRTKKQ